MGVVYKCLVYLWLQGYVLKEFHENGWNIENFQNWYKVSAGNRAL